MYMIVERLNAQSLKAFFKFSLSLFTTLETNTENVQSLHFSMILFHLNESNA